MNSMERYMKFRYVARIVIEADTPICVGSGEKTIDTDSEVALDVNGLPYIPGTTIAGVLRHIMVDVDKNNLFGFQEDGKGGGSRLIVTEARMVGEDGKVVDGLQEELTGAFYDRYENLPIRHHVRISDKGVAENAGKFDEHVVYKGTRFVFEMELLQEEPNKAEIINILDQLGRSTLRFGGGTRKGFGKVCVVECRIKAYNLENSVDLQAYLDKSSSLAADFDGRDFAVRREVADATIYELALEPEDFFLFGSGFGDAKSDMAPMTELVVEWKDGKPEFNEERSLIPATSLKGALRHRTLYHYNRKVGNFADKGASIDETLLEPLFGAAGPKADNMSCGKVLLSDLMEKRIKEKLVNHVAIDRFTGSTIDGALYNEHVNYGKGQSLTTQIVVANGVDGELLNVFETAIKDVCSGMLPLGGGVMRGNGCFTGTLKRNGVQIYPNTEEE